MQSLGTGKLLLRAFDIVLARGLDEHGRDDGHAAEQWIVAHGRWRGVHSFCCCCGCVPVSVHTARLGLGLGLLGRATMNMGVGVVGALGGVAVQCWLHCRTHQSCTVVCLVRLGMRNDGFGRRHHARIGARSGAVSIVRCLGGDRVQFARMRQNGSVFLIVCTAILAGLGCGTVSRVAFGCRVGLVAARNAKCVVDFDGRGSIGIRVGIGIGDRSNMLGDCEGHFGERLWQCRFGQ